MRSPITVRGYIRGRNGEPIPASEIRAGKRIMVENYLPMGEQNLIMLITRSDYNDDSEACQIYSGEIETLPIFLANLGAGFGSLR